MDIRYIIQIGPSHPVKAVSFRKGTNGEQYLDILADSEDVEINKLKAWKAGDGIAKAPACALNEKGDAMSHNWRDQIIEAAPRQDGAVKAIP